MAVEESVHRSAISRRRFGPPAATLTAPAYGFTNPVHRLTFEMKNGNEAADRIWRLAAPSQFPYATVTLDGEQWLMSFLGELSDILTISHPCPR